MSGGRDPRWALRWAAPESGTVAELLIARGALDEGAWWPAVAAHLGLGFRDELATDIVAETGPVPQPAFFREARLFRAPAQGRAEWLALAPRGAEIELIARILAGSPHEARRLVIAPPAAIRAALRRRFLPRIALDAVVGIVRRDPALSALSGASRSQCAALAAIAVSTAWIALAFGATALLPAILIAAWFFLAVSAYRLRAAFALAAVPPLEPLATDDPALPTYAVLVPLYREARVVPGLVRALRRLRYPGEKLHVALVVEEDDGETRAAVEAANRLAGFDVVIVPPGQPRTKPKALDVALAFVDADIVALFDAEDRPDPDQLLLAAAAFRAGGDDLAAVQAELAIDHEDGSETWLSRLFALEYAMLFRGLLPWLAARDLVLPLGGTSNHFRRSALDAVGGWDPHNVTEDADLALRLARAGYRLGVIPSWTDEEAPLRLRAWLGQRSRWLKGWMQTWLVHMRAPRRTIAELGMPSFLAFQAVIGGQLAAAFAYPLGLLALLGLALAGEPFLDERSLFDEVVRVSCLAALLAGFGGTAALAVRVLWRHPDRRLLLGLPLLPVYWLLLSAAAFRAARELVTAPHHWEKTAHGVARRGPGGRAALRSAAASRPGSCGPP